MIPKIGDKVKFKDEWFKLHEDITGKESYFKMLQGQILEVSFVNKSKYDEGIIVVEFTNDSKIYLALPSGKAVYSRKDMELPPLELINIPLDICPKCNSAGERKPMCCICSNCGELIWGI